jgi:hypothetical protein
MKVDMIHALAAVPITVHHYPIAIGSHALVCGQLASGIHDLAK